MNITCSEYIELPVPLDMALAVLRDPTTWAMLPTTAQPIGETWRKGSETYTLTCTADTPAPPDSVMPPAAHNPQQRSKSHVLRWEAAPVGQTGPQTHVYIDVTLYDSVIASHALLRVSLQERGGPWIGQRWLIRWQLARTLHDCGRALYRLLEERQSLAPAQELQQEEVLAASVAVLAGASEREPPASPTTAATDALPRPSAASRNGEGDSLADRLRVRYPQTVAYFEAMDALDHLERVWWLERSWERILRGKYDSTVYEQQTANPNIQAPDPGKFDYDLIYAGGGMGLLHAAVMAQCYGKRVLLFDRSEVGCVHREWNISRSELQALVDIGLATWEELEPVMMREYRAGVIDFHTSTASKVPHADLWFADVLTIALDAGALLRLMRRKLEQAGGTILDRRAFRRVRAIVGRPSSVEVVLEATDAHEEEIYTARLLLDGMGSTSPLALLRHQGQPFAGLCPTVGTVASGFVPGTARNEFDPTVGDILISVADTQDGKQMIWEGFPGRGDELTVYVFYYAALKEAGQTSFSPRRTATATPPDSAPLATPTDAQPRYSLLALFEQYFAMLPSYKKPGPNFRHIKPVYGYIPGRHSLQAQEAPLLHGVLPVGDSAAQQSPLTYCGFGSHVRNLHRTTSLLNHALEHELLEPQHLRHISAFQSNVSLNWVFSRFMQPWDRPQQVNELQNAFLAALNERGGELASRFFRDRMRWHDYNQVVWYTMLHYIDVFFIAWPVLGVGGVWQWFCDYLRFSAGAARATVARALGARGERSLIGLADRISPGWGLRVRAQYAEWRAMGWL